MNSTEHAQRQLAHARLEMIFPNVAVLFEGCGAQLLLDVLRQIDAIHKLSDQHRALRIEQARIDWRERFLDERGHTLLCAVFPAIGNGQLLADQLALDRAVRLANIIHEANEPALIAMEYIAFLLSHGSLTPFPLFP